MLLSCIAPTSAAFIDPSGVQLLAASAPDYASIAHNQHTIAFGNNKAYIIYMHDNRSNATRLDFTVAQWDFSTGNLTQTLLATTGKAGGNAIHNAGSIVRNPQGYLEAFYASNDAGFSTGAGPYYRKTLVPDNISTWSSQISVSQNLMVEPHAAFTPNGYLHVLLGHASGEARYYRRDPQGNWVSSVLIHNITGNNDQAPGYGDWKIVGNTIHLAWSVYQPPFTGSSAGVYYAKSEDNGETWTNISKTASFTRTQGLYQVDPCNPSPPYPALRTEAPCEYPSPFRVASGETSNKGQGVDALSDGTVLVTKFPLTGPALLYVWNSGAWVARTVSSVPHYDAAMEVTSDNKIVIYTSRFSDMNLYEFVSVDTGKTWQSTLIGTNTVQEMAALRVSPPGQDDRMLVVWRSYASDSGYDLNFVSRTMTNTPSVLRNNMNAPASDFSLDIGTGPRGAIRFDINTGKDTPSIVSVYDLLGKRVFTRNLCAGKNTFRHNIGRGGIGLVVLEQGKQKIIKKVLLL